MVIPLDGGLFERALHTFSSSVSQTAFASKALSTVSLRMLRSRMRRQFQNFRIMLIPPLQHAPALIVNSFAASS